MHYSKVLLFYFLSIVTQVYSYLFFLGVDIGNYFWEHKKGNAIYVISEIFVEF